VVQCPCRCVPGSKGKGDAPATTFPLPAVLMRVSARSALCTQRPSSALTSSSAFPTCRLCSDLCHQVVVATAWFRLAVLASPLLVVGVGNVCVGLQRHKKWECGRTTVRICKIEWWYGEGVSVAEGGMGCGTGKPNTVMEG